MNEYAPYEIHVKVKTKVKCPCCSREVEKEVWTPVCPTGSVIPYRFSTKSKAFEMAEMCYGSSFNVEYRIV